jgi:hypothetical protein
MNQYYPSQEQVLAAVRWLITVGGAWAVGKGYISNDQVTLILGAAAALVPLIWSVIKKTQTGRINSAASVPGVRITAEPTASDTVKKAVLNTEAK